MPIEQQLVETRLRNVGVIPILRRMPEQQLMAVAAAVIAAGVDAIELTLDSPGALQAIERLRAGYGDRLLVGAGTVMSSKQLEEGFRAGAQFFLSPHLDTSLVRQAQDSGHPFIPGVLTPTEIVQAEQGGARLMKLFPAGPMGASYLKDILGPFHGRAFFPTGGITRGNVTEFIHAGAVGVGIGSALVPKHNIEEQNWEAITEHVRGVVRTVRDARQTLQAQ